MAKRPLAVTIIAWFLIIGAVFGMYSALTIGSNPIAARMIENSPLSIGAHQIMGVVTNLITLVAAYGMLKGFNRSRYLYLAVGALGVVTILVTMPAVSVAVLSVLMLAVIAFFLFRPNANAWFSGSSRPMEG